MPTPERRALGDDAHSSSCIETISKRGYRLVAPVEAGPFLLSVAVTFTPASAAAEDDLLAARSTQDVTSAVERAMRFAQVVSHGRVMTLKGRPRRDDGRDAGLERFADGGCACFEQLRGECGSAACGSLSNRRATGSGRAAVGNGSSGRGLSGHRPRGRARPPRFGRRRVSLPWVPGPSLSWPVRRRDRGLRERHRGFAQGRDSRKVGTLICAIPDFRPRPREKAPCPVLPPHCSSITSKASIA